MFRGRRDPRLKIRSNGHSKSNLSRKRHSIPLVIVFLLLVLLFCCGILCLTPPLPQDFFTSHDDVMI